MALTYSNVPKVFSVAEFVVTASSGNISFLAEDIDSVIDATSQAISLNTFSAFFAMNNDLSGGGVSISTIGPESSINLSTPTDEIVSNVAVTTSGIMLNYGLPGLIGTVALLKSTMVFSLGEPGVGPSITMTPDSITFQVGATIMTMTAEGIVTTAPTVEVNCEETCVSLSAEGINEVVGEVTREMNAEGHNFTACETEYNIGVAGIVGEAPTQTMELDASAEVNSAMITEAVDAMLSVDSAITMVT